MPLDHGCRHVGILEVHVLEGRNMRKMDTIGKSDPWVEVYTQPTHKERTVRPLLALGRAAAVSSHGDMSCSENAAPGLACPYAEPVSPACSRCFQRHMLLQQPGCCNCCIGLTPARYSVSSSKPDRACLLWLYK